MLRVLKKEEFNNYIDFAWYLSQDRTTSSYPTYLDGIKDKEAFVSKAKDVFDRKDTEILLFSRSDVVYGWIHYYYDLDDDSVFTYTCLCKGQYHPMINEYVEYIQKKYINAHICLGFPSENVDALQAVASKGFDLEEKSNNYGLKMDVYKPQKIDQNHVIKLKKEDFAKFRKLHDAIGIDMYWNSDRIYENLFKWNIYFYEENNEVLGSIYAMDEEILLEVFGLDFVNNQANETVFRSLFTAFLNESKTKGVQHVVYFSDETQEGDYLKSMGFIHVGEYRYFVLRQR